MSRWSPTFLAAVAAVIATPTLASPHEIAPSAQAEAALEVVRGLNVVSMRPMRLSPHPPRARDGVQGGALADAPAIIRISGDPGRLYRIRMPRILLADDSLAVIEELRVWSLGSGDITQSRVAQVGPGGRDVLRVSGRLRLLRPEAARAMFATLPISIDYE
ncbi:hypothetical protein [Caulobacter mirabilis]|uniref:Uncharacterized protein n=1 Tax=Caulobacter mirabilis TaxID=69666 RepID=A0A2D2B0V0_9CAUL|nr:hypothetical protein [Caulobacter mirabilis]ATQ43879.1 hypothetical protein CSW64_16480 [Caulobacter mirabilis]